MRLKIQSPPSANPIWPCTENVHAFWLPSGSTMITMTRDTIVASIKPVQAVMCRQGSRWGKLPLPLIPSACVCSDLMLHMLQVCPLAPHCWVRSIVLRLSICPGYLQPGSWQLSVPRPFMWCCRWVLCPQLRLPDSSQSKVSKLSLGPAHHFYFMPPPPPPKVYLTWKRDNSFLLNYERCAIQNTFPKTVQNCI